MYFYRCTEQQLGDHLTRIHEAGDTLLQAVYKGGRDWVLLCIKGGDDRQALATEIRVLREQISASTRELRDTADHVGRAMNQGAAAGRH